MNLSEIQTFRELSTLWFENCFSGTKYSHTRNIRSFINHLNSYLGDKPLREIKPFDIDCVINDLARCNPTTKRPTAYKTLKELVNTAKRIFEFALDNDLIDKNPARNSLKSIPKNAPQKEVTSVTKEIQKLILTTQHRCQIAAIIMMLMGLRASELLALEWNDISFDDKQATITKHAVRIDNNRYAVEYGTKNGKCRKVAIPDNLCRLLFVERQHAKSRYIFPKTDGTINTPTSWKKAWESYENALNYASYVKNFESENFTGEEPVNRFDPKGFPKTIHITPHQLRHTYATLLYISGVDVLTAKELLGHSDVSITLGIYTHLEKEYKTLNINNFNNYLADELCKDFCKTEKS